MPKYEVKVTIARVYYLDCTADTPRDAVEHVRFIENEKYKDSGDTKVRHVSINREYVDKCPTCGGVRNGSIL